MKVPRTSYAHTVSICSCSLIYDILGILSCSAKLVIYIYMLFSSILYARNKHLGV